MKPNLATAALCAAFVSCVLAHPSLAQTDVREAYGRAQNELESLDREQQFRQSADQCTQHLEARRRDLARIWCALASRRAVAQIDKQYGLEAFPPASSERDIVAKALWLSAVDGLGHQNDPWWGSPRSETIPIGDDVRRLALVVLADMNRENYKLTRFNFGRLASVIGVAPGRYETMGELRRSAFAKLDERRAQSVQAGERPEDASRREVDVLWARAAVGLTLLLGIRDRRGDAAEGGDNARNEGRDVASSLAGLAASAEDKQGEDAALAPALYHAQGWALVIARDYPAAEQALARGAEICPQRIWSGAKLCDDLRELAAFARSQVTPPPPAQ